METISHGGTVIWRGLSENKPDAEGTARLIRDKELRETDWTQLPDAPIDASEKAEWAQYRQELRDLPAQSGFPNVQMPVRPARP